MFQNVSVSDSGEYRCLAGNVLGETSVSVQLRVNSALSADLAVLIEIFLVLVYLVLSDISL